MKISTASQHLDVLSGLIEILKKDLETTAGADLSKYKDPERVIIHGQFADRVNETTKRMQIALDRLNTEMTVLTSQPL